MLNLKGNVETPFFFRAKRGTMETALNIEDNKIVQENLCLPPERKKGIILEGSEEEISSNLVRLLREEEKII